MATELDKGFDRTPTVKFRNVGDSIVGMIVDKRTVPLKKYKSEDVELDKDGNPRSQNIVTVLVMDGTNVDVSETKNGEKIERPAVAGEVVSVFVAKQARFAFYEAKNKLGGNLRVSDVVRVRLDERKPTDMGNPQNVFGVALRRAKADESALSDRAEIEHKRLKGIELEPESAESSSSAAGWDEDF